MLKKIINNLSDNKKNVAKISTGTLTGQIISMITLPIIARIYGAEVIGIWALILSISTLGSSFSDLGLTNSIMIEDEENVEITYTVITTIVTFISIILSIIITIIFSKYVRTIRFSNIFLFFLIALVVFTTKQIDICYTWLNRKGDYNILMKNPIIHHSIGGISSIILGLIGFKAYGYFLGQIIGLVITLMFMKNFVPQKVFTRELIHYKNTISRHKRFINYQMPSNILTSFKNQLPIFLLQGLWGTEIVGYYSMTIKLLQTPVNLLANSIGRVFFQITSAMKRDGKEIGNYVYRNLTRAMKISIIPIIIFVAFGDIFTVVFLGIEWKIAGYFFRILAIQYFFMFLMYTVRGLSITLERQNYAMYSSIFKIIGYFAGALIGKYLLDNVYLGMILMSIFFIIITITYFAALFKVMHIPRERYISNVLLSISGIIVISFVLRYTFNHLGLIELIYKLFRIEV